MPRFAANLSMMFQEHPFLDRFAAARRVGFEAVEYLFPYEHPAEAINQRLTESRLEQVLFNTPPGDWAAGERGTAAIPGREAEFAEGLDLALAYAADLACPRIHAMAGIMPRGADRTTCLATYISNLRLAAERAAARGITVLIEPINTRDIPGYFLNYARDARAVIEAVASPNLRLQLDLYHCQIMEGDLAHHIRDFAEITGHVQIAGVPERHEPDVGEVNYRYLFQVLDATAYSGWVGCEYRPRAGTAEGMSWLSGLPARHGAG
jgi:hydroxypyruvate isomerase